MKGERERNPLHPERILFFRASNAAFNITARLIAASSFAVASGFAFVTSICMSILSSCVRERWNSNKRVDYTYFGSDVSAVPSVPTRERERDPLSRLAASFSARVRERELLSMPALSSLCKGGGSVFFFLLCFFLSFLRLAFEWFGIFDLAS